jgi:hypothetical protein
MSPSEIGIAGPAERADLTGIIPHRSSTPPLASFSAFTDTRWHVGLHGAPGLSALSGDRAVVCLA